MSTSDLHAVPVGTRVTVRHRLPDGRATDVVGPLTAHEPGVVTVRGRDGEVRVALADVVAHRVVRAAPWRVATFLRRAEVAVLDPLGADEPTVAALEQVTEELLAARVPVVLLTDGPAELSPRLARLAARDTPAPAPLVVDRALAGGAGEGWAALHRVVEERLGRPVAVEALRVTGPDPARLAAAREAGWHARLLTPPG